MNNLFSIIKRPDNPIYLDDNTFFLINMIFVAVIIVIAILFKIYQDEIRESETFNKVFRYVFVTGGILYLSYEPILYILRDNKIPYGVLPLQICSLLSVVYILALYKDKYLFLFRYTFFLSFFAVFFALFLSTANRTVNYYHFWNYTFGHSAIFVANMYIFIIKGMRFTPLDVVKGILLLFAIAIFICIPINMLLDTTYMFLHPSSVDRIEILQLFGKWPTLLIPIGILISIITAIFTYITHLLCKNGKFEEYKKSDND